MNQDETANIESRRELLLRRFEEITDLPLTLLALAMVPLLFIPVVTEISQSLDSAFEAVLWFIWAVFALDLAIRTALAEHRVTYLVHHWYDVLIVAIPFLRPLRIARSVRSLRLLRMASSLSWHADGPLCISSCDGAASSTCCSQE